MLTIGGLALAFLCLLAAYGWYRFGSVGALAGVIQGRAAYLEPTRIWLGDIPFGQPMEVPVRLQNLTTGRLRVLGSNSTCSCIAPFKELPCELGPEETRQFLLRFSVGNPDVSEFKVVVTFYVNAEGEQLQAELTGHVTHPDGEPSPGIKSQKATDEVGLR
jgi:hypothetical protein